MRTKQGALRGGAILLGVGAILAAVGAPGAVAQSTGPASARITRAVLIQADASATNVSMATLVTQIQVEGNGDLSFTVPVVAGAKPSNMDSFGGPSVENGQAVYDLTVDGPKTFRTAQSYPADNLPVRVTVEAKLDGKPIDVNDLRGKTGKVELTYTAENLTKSPAELTYSDGAGQPVTEKIDVVTGMGGTIDLTFPPNWSNIESPDATVISGDGGGNTLVNGGFTLMEPFGEPKQTFTVTADVKDGSMPPAVLQFTVLQPKDNPTARSVAEGLKGGALTGQTIFGAGSQLSDGADQLIDGLTSAADGANQIATGVSGSLLPGVKELDGGVQGSLRPGVKELNSAVQGALRPGVQELVKQLDNLPGTVTSSPEFAQLTGGFTALNQLVGGVRQSLGTFSDSGAGQYLTPSGDVDTSKTTVARTLWALIYGVRAADTPPDSAGQTPAEATGGLTNPTCSLANPTDPANPCGAWQVVAGVNAGLGGLSTGLAQAKGGVDQSKGAIDSQLNPGVQQVSAGLAAGADQLANQGAAAVQNLAAVLGCTAAPGPVITACSNPIMVGGNDVAATVGALLTGITGGIYGPGGLSQGLTAAVGGLTAVSNGLTQVSGGLGQVSLGLGVAGAGVGGAQGALAALQGVITSDPTGQPDPNTANGNTATGILSQLRAALALGGIGSSGVPGTCVALGNPPNLDPAQIAATCSAADVLTIALGASQQLQQGVSSTLLEGISSQLVSGVAPLVAGVDELAAGTQQLADGVDELAAGTSELAAGVVPLADGTRQLADGLPAAVDGVQQIKTDAAGGLQKAGAAAAEEFGRRVALYEAMNNPDIVAKYIPGGAPEGQNVTYNGVYKFELAGVGPQQGKPGLGLALGAAGLVAAGAGAAALGRRAA